MCFDACQEKCVYPSQKPNGQLAFTYSEGTTITHIRYTSQPKPGRTIANIRIIIGSILKYSPIPPQTPAIMRFFLERCKRLGSMSKSIPFAVISVYYTMQYAHYSTIRNKRKSRKPWSGFKIALFAAGHNHG